VTTADSKHPRERVSLNPLASVILCAYTDGITVRSNWLPEELSESWDAAVADCPRPKRASAIPWVRSRPGTQGEAVA
jgi:hypothetical protein